MLGAIIGDIVGSRFEFNNYLGTDFEFFGQGCNYTDDSVCTIAVADAILSGKSFSSSLREWCGRYPHPMGSYGGRFSQWLMAASPEPYGSLGNGSAMRCSPCGLLFKDHPVEKAQQIARMSAECTHNHPEGIKGAVCVTHAIWGLLNHWPVERVKRLIIDTYNYQIFDSTDQIRGHYHFDETCPGTLPQAFTCFFESTDFESAIRLAISIGGDSDTIGAIVGGLAEAAYGIPQEIVQKAVPFLPEDFKKVLEKEYGKPF